MAKVRASNTSGGSGGSSFDVILNDSVSDKYGTSHTITGQAGKKVIAFLYSSSSSITAYDTYDGAVTNDGSTITKLCNEHAYNTRGYGTFYQVDVATNSCIISHSTPSFALVFG